MKRLAGGVLIVLLLVCVAYALESGSTNYDTSAVISSGGTGQQSSTNYNIFSTLGQDVVGEASSANYDIYVGFWQSSTAVAMYSYRPVQTQPTITPAYPNTTSDLMCNWNGVMDLNNDPLVNITNWYVDENSLTLIYLPFEGGSTPTYAKDYSGYVNDGVVNGANWSLSGKIGGSYVFDGVDDEISVLSDEMFEYDAATIEAWVYFDNFGGGDDWNKGTVFGRGIWGGVNRCGIFLLHGYNSNAVTAIAETTGSTLEATAALRYDSWYHLAILYDDNRGLELYVNGTRVDNAAADGDLRDCTPFVNFTVGASSTSGASVQHIDNVKVWNRTLSPEQIYENFQAGFSNKSVQLLVRNETALGEEWMCSVTINDATQDSSTINSTAVVINNTPPIQSQPSIVPGVPNRTSDLRCSWNNVYDADDDLVVNITNWYKNNESMTLLYLPFEANDNEENNATDYSGYENTGTVIGATWNRTGGKVGGAYHFKNNNRIEIQHSDMLNISDEFSIEFWAWHNASQSEVWPVLFGKRYQYAVYSNEGSGRYYVYLATDVSQMYINCDSYSIRNDTWQHYVFTIKSGDHKCYVNGVLNATDSDSYTSINTTSNNINIGSWDTGSNDFIGKLDEVKLYNHTLSPEQIYQNYLAGRDNKSSSILVVNETSMWDEFICSVTVNDGIQDGSTLNSTRAIVSSARPSHTLPTITPSNPKDADNLTCNWNNVYDLDDDPLVNITNWYIDNRSITFLNMPFEGGSNSTYAKDYSGFNNHGNVSGPIYNSTAGRIGGGYIFDGTDDYIEFSEDVITSTNFTVESWIYPREETGVVFVQKDENGGAGFVNVVLMVQGDPAARVQIRSTSGDVVRLDYPVNLDEWTHLAFTLDSSNLTLFVNGVRTNSTVHGQSGDYSTSIEKRFIGKSYWSGMDQAYFNGTIDGVWVYNRSLSEQQIYENYVAGSNNRSSSVLGTNETSLGEEWICSVTINDGHQDSLTLNSSSVTVSNAIPAITLQSPTDGNETIINRTPRFIWNASDGDGDPLSFTLYLDDDADFSSLIYENDTNNEYFLPVEHLDVDTQYFWKVNVTDGQNIVNSTVWNFTTLSWVDITLINDTVELGALSVHESKSTDTTLNPFVIENTGNIVINISKVYSNQTLWQEAALGTAYFLFKADNDSTEANSFNFSLSRTSWVMMRAEDEDNQTTIAYLNYNDTNDEAEIDINITVPSGEPATHKQAKITFMGEAS